MAAGQTTIAGVDANGNPVTLLAGSDGTNKSPGHTAFDVNGVPFLTPANPGYVTLAGTTSISFSGGTVSIAAGDTVAVAGTVALNGGTVSISSGDTVSVADASVLAALAATLYVKNKTVTPAACTGSLTLATAGTAQNVQAATSGNGATVVIYNPDNSTDQGISSAEPIWVNAVGAAVAASGGSSMKLNPGTSITIGPTTGAVSWIAATANHKIEAYTLT